MIAVSTRTETIRMPDGGEMTAHLAIPESGSGPGIVTVMEIFGIGDYIREAATRLAALGYVALAPDLYRRTQPGAVFGRGDEGLREAGEAVSRLDVPGAIEDAGVAQDHLRSLPECTGSVGVLGFCLGGTLAFGLAQAADPATAVCYYGSGIPDMLHDADAITCPVLMHWGAQDPYVALEQAEQCCRAASGRPDWECHIHRDGGHAFDNWDNPRFHQPRPAAEAWAQTRAFLARTLPV